jgi:hypothetical protein
VDPEFDGGDTRDGVEQLLGNAAEWAASLLGQKDGQIVPVGHWNGSKRVQSLSIMGGAWDERIMPWRFAMQADQPTDFDDDIGFRCVQTA